MEVQKSIVMIFGSDLFRPQLKLKRYQMSDK